MTAYTTNNPKVGQAVLECKHISKAFKDQHKSVQILDELNFVLSKGEIATLAGTSGSGKTTFLHCLSGLESIDTGNVLLAGCDLASLNENKKSQLRNQSLGFVYQFHHLFAEFTAVENVAMPLLIGGEDHKAANKKATSMLEQVGLDHRLTHKPTELSGGEKQRVALARALVTEPDCVLADEPTGNLDQQTAEEIKALILQLNINLDIAFLIVTHDPKLAAIGQSQYQLIQGKLERKN